MANVSITIPDALVPRVRAAMRAKYPEHEALSDAAAFKRVTADHWRGILRDYETGQARDTAEAAVRDAIARIDSDSAGIG